MTIISLLLQSNHYSIQIISNYYEHHMIIIVTKQLN